MYQYIIILVISNFVSIGGWLFTIKASKIKSNAESKISEFEATNKIIDIYKKLSDDLRRDYERRISEMKIDIEKMRGEIKELSLLKCNKEQCENRQ